MKYLLNPLRLCLHMGLLATTATVQGCLSLQMTKSDGTPQVIGCGSTTLVASGDGDVYRVKAPGFSVRSYAGLSGLSLGWQEVLLFYPAHSPATNRMRETTEPIAYQKKTIGMDISAFMLAVGYDRVFAVPMPAAGTSVIQFVSYSDREPWKTRVERKEMP